MALASSFVQSYLDFVDIVAHRTLLGHAMSRKIQDEFSLSLFAGGYRVKVCQVLDP